MDVDVAERDVAGELDPHHHHPRDPEEDDLPRGRQEAGGIKGLQIGGLLGPAEGGERPQRRAEPRVEHVRLPLQGGRVDAALARRGRRELLRLGDDLLAVRAVPDRDLVAPPELARHAPRPDPPHPVEVDPLVALGDDPDLVAVDDLDRGRRQLLHPAEPLQGDQRLDPLAGALGERHGVLVGALAPDQPLLAQRGHDGGRGVAGGQALVRLPGRRVHAPVLADHGDLLELVAAADLEVVGVVAGRDLERAGAELGVDVLVGDDRQAPADERQRAEPADQLAVAVVVGMDRDGGVGEHRLRAHGRDREGPVAVLERIVDLIEGVGDLPVDDLEVRDRGARPRVPVDEVVVAVDEALVVERDEDAVDGAHVALVEREALVLVVAGGAEALVLLDDLPAVALAPLPDPLEEGLTAELVAGCPLRAELLLDHHLGPDAGVVRAEDPERVAAPHAVDPRQRVLNRAVERVPDVQRPGDVGGRDRDRVVAIGRPLRRRREDAAVEPIGKDPRLGLGGIPPRGRLELCASRGVHGSGDLRGRLTARRAG